MFTKPTNISRANKVLENTMKMNSVARERNWTREETNCMFWIERLFLFLLVIFPTYLLDLIVLIIFFTSIFTIPFFFTCPNLSSAGPSGIGGIWLFLLDRSTFYLAYEYFKLMAGGFELAFLWRLTVFLSILIHSVYILEHFLESHQAVPPPPLSQNDETSGDVSKQVEKMKELVDDGKKMMKSIEHMIHSGLDTNRNEWGEFLDELSKDEKTKMTKLDATICSQLGTLRDNIRLNIEEIRQELRDELRSTVDKDIKASRQEFNKDVKSVANQLHETYLVIQETVKEANAHETYLVDQNKRRIMNRASLNIDIDEERDDSSIRMTRGEDVEGFVELREQVHQMAMEAEIAAEELTRATVELVEAGIQQWEEDNADYLASLPLLYRNHN